MRSGARRRLVLAGLPLALVGCSASQSCTLIGCASGVSIDVRDLTAAYSALDTSATVCVSGTCETKVIHPDTLDVSVSFAGNASPAFDVTAPVAVTLTVVRAGRTIVDASTSVTLARSAPNGERCGPVCWDAALVLTGSTLAPVTSTPSS